MFYTFAMNYRARFEQLIKQGKINKLIDEVIDFAKQHDSELYHNFILLSARWSRNEEKHTKYIISESDHNIEANKITSAITEYLRKCEALDAFD